MTPLKALIQERLRAKIVRQEGEGDEIDEVISMGHEHHNRHHHQSHHERYSELQSPSQLQRGAGCAHHQQHQSTHDAPEYRVRESSATATDHHHHKRHKSSATHSQQTQRRHNEQDKQPQYTTNQKLIDYYTWEHHQKYDISYFPQDRHNFGHTENLKTPNYEDERSPQPSPWKGPSVDNHFQGEEEETKFPENPRYAPPPQQQHQRVSNADLHPRNSDSRGPVVTHRSSRAVEPNSSSFAHDTKRDSKHRCHQKLEQSQPHDGCESVHNVSAKSSSSYQSQERQQAYPQGHFESQLYDEDIPDMKHNESTPNHHRRERHHHRKHQAASNLEPENPQVTSSRKRGFGSFDVGNTSYELRHYESVLSNNNNISSEHSTQGELSYHHQQCHRHHNNYTHEQRFGHEDMVRSPLAAATSLAPLVFAAVTSPRLETKRGFFSQSRKRELNHDSTGSASASTFASATTPAPLDMVVIEATRRRDDIDAMPAIGSNIHRRSVSTLVRHLDAMLSPGCHRAATAFVEKRRRRTANSTPRTMATQRWLQSMDEKNKSATATHDNHYAHQHYEAVLPQSTALYSARSASSYSHSGSSSSSCTSPL